MTAPLEADKELDEILAANGIHGRRQPKNLKTTLLAWRDKSQQALYQRLAAEAVILWLAYPTGSLSDPVKAIPISKLKAIMEIKDEPTIE